MVMDVCLFVCPDVFLSPSLKWANTGRQIVNVAICQISVAIYHKPMWQSIKSVWQFVKLVQQFVGNQ